MMQHFYIFPFFCTVSCCTVEVLFLKWSICEKIFLSISFLRETMKFPFKVLSDFSLSLSASLHLTWCGRGVCSSSSSSRNRHSGSGGAQRAAPAPAPAPAPAHAPWRRRSGASPFLCAGRDQKTNCQLNTKLHICVGCPLFLFSRCEHRRLRTDFSLSFFLFAPSVLKDHVCACVLLRDASLNCLQSPMFYPVWQTACLIFFPSPCATCSFLSRWFLWSNTCAILLYLRSTCS